MRMQQRSHQIGCNPFDSVLADFTDSSFRPYRSFGSVTPWLRCSRLCAYIGPENKSEPTSLEEHSCFRPGYDPGRKGWVSGIFGISRRDTIGCQIWANSKYACFNL